MSEASVRIDRFRTRLSGQNQKIFSALLEAEGMSKDLAADVLLVTTTQVETDSLFAELEKFGYARNVLLGEIATYSFFGRIGGAYVAHIRTNAGSGGTGGSSLAVSDAISELRPSCVIAVGIAFAMDADAYKIGDVLISEKITAYELSRIGTDSSGSVEIRSRGTSVECSARLLGRFRDAGAQGDRFAIHSGEVLSGEKLIDNAEFKSALKARFPDAIGGEMEGAGLQAASDRKGTEWIVVKSVCDYAENKGEDKQSRQRLAASNAAGLARAVLEMGGLRKRGREHE